jgi:arginine/ornithine N-succinyltransferase beta subunit
MLMGTQPEAECIGIQILDMDGVEIGLTEPVEAAVPAAVAAALQVLAERGITAEPRDEASIDGRVLEAIRTWAAAPGREPSE